MFSSLVGALLAASALSRLGRGLHVANRNPNNPWPTNNLILGVPVIPKTVYITAPPLPQTSALYTEMTPAQQNERAVVERFSEFLGSDIEIQFFDDNDMNESAFEISEALEQAGITSRAYEAFANLRPMAYKADLWRYMILWYRGGVYLDMNLHLLSNLSSWVDFRKDELVLIHDACDKEPCPKYKFWNAMLAARPRSMHLMKVIQQVVDDIMNHSYGVSDLDVTGPTAFGRALESIEGIDKHITVDFRLKSNFEPGVLCGGVPRPRCNVSVEGINWDKTGVVVAEKNSKFEQFLPEIVRGANHYSGLWRKHSIYCDEPGPPCSVVDHSPVFCSAIGEDCRGTRCCLDYGHACVEKDVYWAGCRSPCEAGSVEPGAEGPHANDPWSCRVLNSSGPIVMRGRRGSLPEADLPPPARPPPPPRRGGPPRG